MAVERINRLTDLLAQTLAGFVISVAGILLMDGLFALLGLGKFGDLNGWLALIYPIIVFAGQFSAAKGERFRLLVTVVGALLGLAVGSFVAGLASAGAPLVSGGAGALTATLVYAAAWHVGMAMAARSE